MASMAETPGGPNREGRKRKHAGPFAGAVPMAIIGLIGTAIGFFPTFFARLGEVDFAHQLHGWTMTGWLLVVLVQALLIRSRQFKWHRLLGWSSVVMFALMFASSWQMLVLMLSGKTHLPFEMAKFFGWTDIIDMPLILFLYGGAIYWRKDRHLHSRLIATTVLATIVPALARMFNILIWRSLEGLYLAMHPTYILILGVLAAAIWVDRKNGVLRWPLPFVFAWFVVDYVTLWPVAQSQWYDGLARAIASLA